MLIRPIRPDELAIAARQHRVGGCLIPGFDPTCIAFEATLAQYEALLQSGEIWVAEDNDVVVGHIGLEPGWVDQLFIETDKIGTGVGRALILFAQQRQDDLQLYTFQSNSLGRRFYERAGFVIADMTDGARNAEGQPDIRYHWMRERDI